MTLAIGIVALLALAALVTSIMTLMGKCPPGVPELLLSVALLVSLYPK